MQEKGARTYVAVVKEVHERLENLDVVRSAEVVPKQGLVQTRTRLEQDGDGLSLGLARLGLEETVLLKVSQSILRLDVEASSTDEEDSLLILGRDEGLRRRPGLLEPKKQGRGQSMLFGSQRVLTSRLTDGQGCPPVSTRSAMAPTADRRISRQMN